MRARSVKHRSASLFSRARKYETDKVLNRVIIEAGSVIIPEKIREISFDLREIAYRKDEWKYLHSLNSSDELYDLKKDPSEKENLISVEKEIFSSMLPIACAKLDETPLNFIDKISLLSRALHSGCLRRDSCKAIFSCY